MIELERLLAVQIVRVKEMVSRKCQSANSTRHIYLTDRRLLYDGNQKSINIRRPNWLHQSERFSESSQPNALSRARASQLRLGSLPDVRLVSILSVWLFLYKGASQKSVAKCIRLTHVCQGWQRDDSPQAFAWTGPVAWTKAREKDPI